MKKEKCLAYIWPAEDIDGKTEALANVKFLTGPYERKIGRYILTTSIYKYYYWGVTFEVVTLAEDGSITEVADVKKEDLAIFGMNIIHALSFNSCTHEVLGSNGFVYKLDQSLFYRNCKAVCDYIYEMAASAENIVMQMYTLNGGIIAILFDKDLSPNSTSFKYAIQRGFVTADNKLLRSMVPKTDVPVDNKEILDQRDIDRLIQSLSKASVCLELK